MDPRPGEGRGAARGKLILLGEHVVVHGAPALVAGIALEVRAHARTAGAGRSLQLYDVRTRAGDDDELARAFAALLEEGGAPSDLEVRLEGELLPGVGLGFSAAAAVAIARAVEDLAGRRDGERVRARAMAWERVFHGNPSGVDVAAAMRGGATRFTRAEGARSVRVAAPLWLAVGLTGTRSSTREMVEGVAEIGRQKPELLERSVEGVAALVENAVGAVEAGDVRALGDLMNLNQMILAGLMLSTAALEELCATAREAGALGAKLTGAGGGGAMVALGPDRATLDRIVFAWGERGYQGFATGVEADAR
jgi:mevalonate kinase